MRGDFGASQHITFSNKHLYDLIDVDHLSLTVAHPNGTVAQVKLIGTFKLNNNLIVKDVLVVPKYHDSTQKFLMGTGSERGCLYFLDEDGAARTKETAEYVNITDETDNLGSTSSRKDLGSEKKYATETNVLEGIHSIENNKDSYDSEGEDIESFGHMFESLKPAVGQSVRRTSRKTTMTFKCNDYVLSKGVKYGIDKVFNYSNLSFENFVFPTSLNKIKGPATYSEAAKDNRWVEEMNLEMEAINRNETWVITDLPSDREPIGNLDEDVYMTLLERYSDIGDKRVCKLVKSLYGIKQASMKWNEKLTSVLLADGFVQSLNDFSLFIKNEKDFVLILLVYVDDIIVT
ncbi:ribonuclease H-like domain-containing protein, partial [Tanacetum coccineum]